MSRIITNHSDGTPRTALVNGDAQSRIMRVVLITLGGHRVKILRELQVPRTKHIFRRKMPTRLPVDFQSITRIVASETKAPYNHFGVVFPKTDSQTSIGSGKTRFCVVRATALQLPRAPATDTMGSLREQRWDDKAQVLAYARASRGCHTSRIWTVVVENWKALAGRVRSSRC